MSLDTVIQDLIAFDTEIDSVQIAEVLFLTDVMGGIEKQKKRLEEGDSTEDNGTNVDNKNATASQKKEYYDVTHVVDLSPKNKESKEHNFSFEEEEDSSEKFVAYIENEYQLPNIIKEFQALKIKQKVDSKHRINESKTADYMAITGFFHPIYEEEKEVKKYLGINLVIDTYKSMFLWEEHIEHLKKSVENAHVFREVNLFFIDSGHDKIELLNENGIKSRTKVNCLKEENFLNLVVSDVVGKLWREEQMFRLLDAWSQHSFTVILSLLPRRIWQKTPLRLGMSQFMKTNKALPKNRDLKAEYDFVEETLTKEMSKIPIIPYDNNAFKNLSNLLVNRKETWIDTRIFNLEKEVKPPVKTATSNSTTLNNIEAEERVNRYFNSVDIESKKLAIYASILPLHKRVIDALISLKKIGHDKDAFVEFYFGGLLDIKASVENEVFSFHKGVRQALLQYIDIDEAYEIYEMLNDIVTSTLNLNISLLELLHGRDIKSKQGLEPIEKELVSLLIEVLESKGKYYNKEIRNLKGKIDTIHPKTNTYQMGSNDGYYDDEKPVHQITFDYDFEIAKTPVTFEEYDLYCEAKGIEKPDDEGWGRRKRAVINVSWDDAQAYCKWLSEKTKKEYRLPTEAEWEYVCRAGTTTKWSFGDDEKELGKYAWYDKNSYDLGSSHKDYGTHPVGEKLANPWGLYDMHGNVWEWCQDDWVDNYNDTPRDGTAYKGSENKVVRGGSWVDLALNSRSAYRYNRLPTNRYYSRGFRILRTLP